MIAHLSDFALSVRWEYHVENFVLELQYFRKLAVLRGWKRGFHTHYANGLHLKDRVNLNDIMEYLNLPQ